MSELVVILKDGNKRNVKGAVLADKAAPPFTERRDGYRLRWWGADHSASVRIRALVEKAEEYTNGLCPFMAECYKTLGFVLWSVHVPPALGASPSACACPSTPGLGTIAALSSTVRWNSAAKAATDTGASWTGAM